MKGPGYKLSHDVRRTWRCPACGTERKLEGDITSLKCNCRTEGTFMTIVVERTVAPRPLQVPNEQDVRSSEFGIDDLPPLVPHPSSLPPERTGPRRPRPDSSSRGTEPVDPSEPSESVDVTAESTPLPVDDKPAATPDSISDATEPANESDDDWGAGIL